MKTDSTHPTGPEDSVSAIAKTMPDTTNRGTPAMPIISIEPAMGVMLQDSKPASTATNESAADANERVFSSNKTCPSTVRAPIFTAWDNVPGVVQGCAASIAAALLLGAAVLAFVLPASVIVFSVVLFGAASLGLVILLIDWEMWALLYLIVLPVVVATIAGCAVPVRHLMEGRR